MYISAIVHEMSQKCSAWTRVRALLLVLLLLSSCVWWMGSRQLGRHGAKRSDLEILGRQAEPGPAMKVIEL